MNVVWRSHALLLMYMYVLTAVVSSACKGHICNARDGYKIHDLSLYLLLN